MLPVDDEADFEQLKKNAEQGDANEQYNLGWMYEYGRGVAQDDVETCVWRHLNLHIALVVVKQQLQHYGLGIFDFQ